MIIFFGLWINANRCSFSRVAAFFISGARVIAHTRNSRSDHRRAEPLLLLPAVGPRMDALKTASVEAAFLFRGARGVVKVGAHVRAKAPRRANRHRRKGDARAGFQIRYANNDVGAYADAFAICPRGKSVVVALATEISEEDAGFFPLVVEIGVDLAVEFATLVALHWPWLVATVTGGRRKEIGEEEGRL